MLRQSQKLEAIGQLTGGVAHDFNNLLQVIIGNLDRARRIADNPSPALDRALSHALLGAERAAELTDRLLSFARRQPLDPQPIDAERNGREHPPADRAGGRCADLCGRRAMPGGNRDSADRSQLENALLNLALNARDAMPAGGELRISCHGDDDTVELRIADNGSGMDGATLERATEPFFTTKPIGDGTGLGLSQVYGMMEQIGGRMEIEFDLGNRHHGAAAVSPVNGGAS